MRRTLAILAVLAAGTASAFAQAPKEITLPIEATISLQVGETRIFQFGEAVNRVGISDDNVLEVRAVQEHAFAFKGLSQGGVTVTARSEDSSEVHRMRVIVGGHLVRVYSPDEPDPITYNCDEFGCGAGNSNKKKPNSVTVRTPTRGGGFIDRNYQ